jgi:predicted peroxiredoxin
LGKESGVQVIERQARGAQNRCERSSHMAEARNLVIVVTRGIDDERSSVALTLANGALTCGLEVSLFLTSSGVDLARRHALDTTHVKPLEPLAAMVRDFLARGGTLWACTPCVQSRGYAQEHLIEGAIITGARPMHELILAGAATLTF